MERKELLCQYKETPRPAGVFRVANTSSGRMLVGSSPNVPGMLNRQRFQLQNGSHPDRELQKDWNELGPAAFVFETLDLLKPSEDPASDKTADLAVLKDLWLEKLASTGAAFYPQTNRVHVAKG